VIHGRLPRPSGSKHRHLPTAEVADHGSTASNVPLDQVGQRHLGVTQPKGMGTVLMGTSDDAVSECRVFSIAPNSLGFLAFVIANCLASPS